MSEFDARLQREILMAGGLKKLLKELLTVLAAPPSDATNDETLRLLQKTVRIYNLLLEEEQVKAKHGF